MFRGNLERTYIQNIIKPLIKFFENLKPFGYSGYSEYTEAQNAIISSGNTEFVENFGLFGWNVCLEHTDVQNVSKRLLILQRQQVLCEFEVLGGYILTLSCRTQ